MKFYFFPDQTDDLVPNEKDIFQKVYIRNLRFRTDTFTKTTNTTNLLNYYFYTKNILVEKIFFKFSKERKSCCGIRRG